MTVLDDWTAAVCDQLGITDLVDEERARDVVLDLARAVAHGVERPAAPVTAFLLGLAAGRATDPDAATSDHAAAIADLVARFQRR